jgi:hypothetical protein
VGEQSCSWGPVVLAKTGRGRNHHGNATQAHRNETAKLLRSCNGALLQLGEGNLGRGHVGG